MGHTFWHFSTFLEIIFKSSEEKEASGRNQDLYAGLSSCPHTTTIQVSNSDSSSVGCLILFPMFFVVVLLLCYCFVLLFVSGYLFVHFRDPRGYSKWKYVLL